MTASNVEIHPDAGELARAGAEWFALLADRAAVTRGVFSVALAGGSTPRQMYTLLTGAYYRERVPWSQVQFFWGDERCVPPDHADSNFRMAREALLTHIPISPGQVHRIHGELPPGEAAALYESELRLEFSETGLPRFDLILLGLGEDGHTASLFPGDPALAEQTRLAAAVIHHTPPLPLVSRVTLTLPVLNAATFVMFLVGGAGKAQPLAEVLAPGCTLPAARVRPLHGEVRWLVERAAAAALD